MEIIPGGQPRGARIAGTVHNAVAANPADGPRTMRRVQMMASFDHPALVA
jgi:hypothetical protein